MIFKIKRWPCNLFLLALALPAGGLRAADNPNVRPASSRTDALSRAAQEFKTLTSEWGMRPESPTTLQNHHNGKWLWHGRIYENLRNDILDAVPHQVIQNGGTKSPLRRNQFGINVSGPLLIPRLLSNPKSTFFMFSYEGVREHISRASLHTIPTVAERRGDFSHTVDQAGNMLPIYDPASTSLNPSYDPTQPVSTTNLQYLRSTFPGNIIPENRLDPDFQNILSLYPLPNTSVGPFDQNNYFVNSPETDVADGVVSKVDRQFGDSHRLTWATTISSGFLGSAKLFPNIASPTPADQNFSTRRSELDYVYTASPNTVNTASLTLISEVENTGAGSGTPFPRYEMASEYLSLGHSNPSTRNARNTFELRDELTARRDKHSLSLTLQADDHQVNSLNPAYPSGYFEFSPGLTSLPGITDTGDPFASFLLGLPDYGERTIITEPSYFRDTYLSLSARDKYELSKNLNFSVSLRLSRRTPRTEKYDRQSTVDPKVINPETGLAGALVFAGRDGVPRGLRDANVDLDPSFGLAWNPRGDAKTVVHASFSQSHGRISIYNGQWGTQGFNARQTFISPNTELTPALDLTNGIPPYTAPLPDLSPSAADDTVADFVDLSGLEPVYQSASLSIEREVPFSMVVSVGTNYNRGWNILVGDSAANPNAIDPSLMSYGNALYDQAFRETLQPFPQYKGFELFGHYAAGRYQRNSGFLRVEKHASFGLSFIAYYEVSKQLDDYSGPYGNQDLLNLLNNWSLTAYNTPQYLQLSYIYDLPFGADHPLLHLSGWGGKLVQGWSINGTAYWNDGVPLALHPEFNNTGGVLSTLNVNVVPGVDPAVPNPGPALWFNPAAFDQPPDFTLGNASRTQPNLLGPGQNSMDLSVRKRLPVPGGRALEFSAEAFDLFNHANWNYPDTGIGPASAPNIDAGKIIGSNGGRVVQLGLKLSF